MKLYPLSPTSGTAINIQKFSKKLGIDVITQSGNFNTIVIIGNGTPDDIVFAIICHHLNGTKVVAIDKPAKKTGVAVLDFLQSYLDSAKIKKLVVLVDQEDKKLNDIFRDAERRPRKLNVKIEEKEEMKEESRLKIYTCKLGNKRFELILIINGCDDIKTETHSIEDHLLKVVIEEGLDYNTDYKNSKDFWNSLNETQQLEILRKIKDSKKIFEAVFRQQIKGCKKLEKEIKRRKCSNPQ